MLATIISSVRNSPSLALLLGLVLCAVVVAEDPVAFYKSVSWIETYQLRHFQTLS